MDEVWRWNPQTTSTQFISDPSLPDAGLPEWNVWRRGFPIDSDLTDMPGNRAYLLKVASGASPFTLQIQGRPVPPHYTWKRSGLNLFGFPVPPGTGNADPSFSDYFASEPLLSIGTDVLKYVGGDLSPSNPVPVFNRNAEIVVRGSAYWIGSSSFSTYYGPLRIRLSNPEGLLYGDTGSLLSVHLTNLAAEEVTVTLTPVNSESAPSGEVAVAGSVPFLLREFDADEASFVFNPFGSNQVRTLGSQETTELVIAVDRGNMGATSGELFQSILRITDSMGALQVDLPVAAEVTSLAGLWVGEAVIDRVQNQLQRFEKDGAGNYLVDNDGHFILESSETGLHATSRQFPLRLILHMDEAGNTRLLSHVFAGQVAADSGLSTSEDVLDQESLADAVRISSAHLPLDLNLLCSGSLGLSGTVDVTVSIPHNDPTNPFVHTYHPDHDNLDARFEGTLPAGKESYAISRSISFSFQSSLEGVNDPGFGATVLGGTYTEVITGLHKNSIALEGVFLIHRLSDIATLTTN